MVRIWIRIGIKQLDPDPYQIEQQDPDRYQSEKQDLDPQHWTDVFNLNSKI
jgi:hypothetical protein